MREIAVVSGKGGTGKTSLVAQFARLAKPVVVADTDVDAANQAVLFAGLDGPHMPFFTGERASIDLRLCTRCGTCAETCRFDSISVGASGLPFLDPFVCEGCGACVHQCPANALNLHENMAGVWAERPVEVGTLVHAMLGVAQDNSGTLVTQVREQARQACDCEQLDTILVDGPPGLGKPVQAALHGADLVVVITEASVSGSHDLDRVLDIAMELAPAVGVVINKADLDPTERDNIVNMAATRKVPLLGEIPFCDEVPRALARGELPFSVDVTAPLVEQIWGQVVELLDRRASAA